jgi:hypothetical protein
MELMLTPDQLDKAVYPSVTEGATIKSTETNPQKDLVGDSDQDGPKCGLFEGKLGNMPLEDGPGAELDPQEFDSGHFMEENRGDNHGHGDGPTRRWKRRIRSPTLFLDQTKGGKRDSVQAGLGGGEDSTELGKKVRLDAETVFNMAWAEAGHQPRQPQ